MEEHRRKHKDTYTVDHNKAQWHDREEDPQVEDS
jgi:hypothetical protein